MDHFSIQPLTLDTPWRAQIAAEQFGYWGALTGHGSTLAYEAFLEQTAGSVALPRVLMALRGGELLGSVTLMAQEMTIRPQLTPWLGALFVREAFRADGVGTRLVEAAISYVSVLGYGELFLFTSGALPGYYRKRGWVDVETVEYLGKQRTIMRFDIGV